jgi:hypothetical protein
MILFLANTDEPVIGNFATGGEPRIKIGIFKPKSIGLSVPAPFFAHVNDIKRQFYFWRIPSPVTGFKNKDRFI